MAVCDNCGIDSDLTLEVKLNSNLVAIYCPDYECMEEAKMNMGSIRDSALNNALGMEVIGEGKNS